MLIEAQTLQSDVQAVHEPPDFQKPAEHVVQTEALEQTSQFAGQPY